MAEGCCTHGCDGFRPVSLYRFRWIMSMSFPFTKRDRETCTWQLESHSRRAGTQCTASDLLTAGLRGSTRERLGLRPPRQSAYAYPLLPSRAMLARTARAALAQSVAVFFSLLWLHRACMAAFCVAAPHFVCAADAPAAHPAAPGAAPRAIAAPPVPCHTIVLSEADCIAWHAGAYNIAKSKAPSELKACQPHFCCAPVQRTRAPCFGVGTLCGLERPP